MSSTPRLGLSASPWIVSARFDLLAFSLPALIGLAFGSLSGTLTEPSGDTPAWAWLLFVVGIDVAHVHATTLRVYCDPRELMRRPWLYGVTPLACLALGVVLYSCSAALFWRCLAYVALFHFALDLEQATPLLVPLLTVPQLTHYLLDGFLWRLDGNNPAFADWLAGV